MGIGEVRFKALSQLVFCLIRALLTPVSLNSLPPVRVATHWWENAENTTLGRSHPVTTTLYQKQP
jgi:hypothetical protein